jgi:YegS/Rv2252/BmrU family lipid kinase
VVSAQHLDPHVALQVKVSGAVDVRHPTRAQLAEDLIAPYQDFRQRQIAGLVHGEDSNAGARERQLRRSARYNRRASSLPMATARLIYNPAAGRFPVGPMVDRAALVLSQAGWELQTVEVQGRQSLTSIAQQAVAEGCTAVFVAGGDGSVGQVAAALAGTETALGVLPAGTANVWAKELGLPRLDWLHWFALEEAAQMLAQAEVRQVDMGECNGRYFLLWAGLGIDGRVIHSLEPRDRWEKALGEVHYVTRAVWKSLDWGGISLRVQAAGKAWEEQVVVAVASNIRAYAGGLVELAPDAKIDDGLLDFWLVSGNTIIDTVYRTLQILLGAHLDDPGIVHFQSREATFEAEGILPMHVDGEPLDTEAPVRFRVHPKALRVLVPEALSPTIFLRRGGASLPP